MAAAGACCGGFLGCGAGVGGDVSGAGLITNERRGRVLVLADAFAAASDIRLRFEQRWPGLRGLFDSSAPSVGQRHHSLHIARLIPMHRVQRVRHRDRHGLVAVLCCGAGES
jgi:hypothetical protein